MTTVSSTYNYQRWVSLGFVALSAVVFAFTSKLAEFAWDLLAWNLPDWALSPFDLFGLACGALTFLLLRRATATNDFLNEAALELARVTWPAQKDTMLSTFVITVVIMVCAGVLSIFNSIWAWLVNLVY